MTIKRIKSEFYDVSLGHERMGKLTDVLMSDYRCSLARRC